MCDLAVADGGNVSNLDVWVLSEDINETNIGVQELASTPLIVQVVIETEDNFAGCVVDGEQELMLLPAVRRERMEVAEISEVLNRLAMRMSRPTRSEQVLGVGKALGRRLDLGDDVPVGDVIVEEIGNQIVTKHLQVLSEGHLVLNRGTDREHVGEETDYFLKLNHRT